MKYLPSAIALVLVSLQPSLGHAEEIPSIQNGLCGSAKAIDNYFESAGFFLEPTMVVLAPDGAHMVYLPQPERVKRMKESGRFGLGMEKVLVLHQDSSPEHLGGWRCITSVGTIMESERKSLTKYLNFVDSAVR